MGGQALVAGGDAQHALSRRQRPDQTAQHHGRVVAVGQRVHHPGRALRAAVARVGDETGERDHAEILEARGRRLHQQADLPVAGVIAERDRRAVRRADAALRAQDQEFRVAQAARRPAHAGVLREAEDVAAGRVAQELIVERQRAAGAGRVRLHVEEFAIIVVNGDAAV